jgi:hypothetical protein
MVEYKWKGYPDMKRAPGISNINRTCVDLLNGGSLVVSRIKRDPLAVEWLPTWEKQYQLADRVEYLCDKSQGTCTPINVEELEELTPRIEDMLQSTFEVHDYRSHFKKMMSLTNSIRILKGDIGIPMEGELLLKGTS